MDKINGSLIMMCAFFSLMLIMSLFGSPQWRKGTTAKRAFLIMFFTLIELLCEGSAYLFFFDNGAMFSLLSTCAGIVSYIVAWCFVLFVVSQVRISRSFRRVILVIVGFESLAGIILYLLNYIHPFIYDFQSETYIFKEGYIIFSVLNYVSFFVALILLLFRGSSMALRDRIFFTLVPLLPLTAYLWDHLIPGLNSWYPLEFVAMAAVYIHLMFVMAEEAQHKIDRLELRRVKATLERIKPHYIYNVLTSIYYLCDQNVGTAKEAIRCFSDYLRETLNMMEEHDLVPFLKELETVRNYLKLEKMRFGEKISVRYEIQAEDFLLPPFSLQPLVENSVKHGAANTDLKGEIVIASREKPDRYEVSVTDTFEGFTPPSHGSGEGSATRYIREILALTVNGTLEIRIAPGKGAVSVITIPKQTKSNTGSDDHDHTDHRKERR